VSQVVPPQAAVPPAPRVRGGGPRSRASLGSRRRLVVAVVIVVGAIGYLLYQGLGNAAEYFRTADQAVADKGRLGTRRFRIEGTVDPGLHTVGRSVDFQITANNVTVDVVHTGAQPQLFKPGVPVVLDGHWVPGEGFFASDTIEVKHDEDYKTSHPERLKRAGATQ
jgi:cytochrome c-type biogenesis protein CcmE